MSLFWFGFDAGSRRCSRCTCGVVLARDAAHVHSPAGGQELIGIGGALSLGEHVAAAARGDEDALDGYPAGAAVQEWSLAPDGAGPPQPPLEGYTACGLRHLLDAPGGAASVFRRIAGS